MELKGRAVDVTADKSTMTEIIRLPFRDTPQASMGRYEAGLQILELCCDFRLKVK